MTFGQWTEESRLPVGSARCARAWHWLDAPHNVDMRNPPRKHAARAQGAPDLRQRVFEIVKSAVLRLNGELQYESLREVNENTPIFGGAESIDSLSLVTLVVELEEDVEKALEMSVVLADASAMSQRWSPYRSVGSLVDLIITRLKNRNG